jgi:hypothetical protein
MTAIAFGIAHTVTFEDISGRTKLTMHAKATGFSVAAPQMLAGMTRVGMGLDRLAELVKREA